MQLLEVILVEIGEEARRADRMRRDLEIVNVLVPVVADVGSGGTDAAMDDTAHYYKIKADGSAMRAARSRHGSTSGTYDCWSSAAAFTAWRARTTPRAAACASRWSRPTTSAAAPRSTIRRPRTAACARCGSGRLGRARESIRERRALARIAPWLLRPLPFLVGTYRSVVQEPARAARGVQARRVARTAPQRRRRAGAAPAGAAARLEGRDAAPVSRRPAGAASPAARSGTTTRWSKAIG